MYAQWWVITHLCSQAPHMLSWTVYKQVRTNLCKQTAHTLWCSSSCVCVPTSLETQSWSKSSILSLWSSSVVFSAVCPDKEEKLVFRERCVRVNCCGGLIDWVFLWYWFIYVCVNVLVLKEEDTVYRMCNVCHWELSVCFYCSKHRQESTQSLESAVVSEYVCLSTSQYWLSML